MKAYGRRGKNAEADAEAMWEAVGRPNMRFVPIKTEDQQAALMLHKARELLRRQQTMLVNALRAHMAELGMVAPQGRRRVEAVIAVIEDDEDESIPRLAKAALKTADSGYLTRKLADVCQNMVITKHDCGTTKGITRGVVYRAEKVEVNLADAIRGRVSRTNIVNPITDDVIVRKDAVITI